MSKTKDSPLTKAQRTLMFHALGIDNRQAVGKAYRNRYYVAAGTPDADRWNEIVAAGYAVSRPPSGDAQQSIFFAVSLAGVHALGVAEQVTCDLIHA